MRIIIVLKNCYLRIEIMKHTHLPTINHSPFQHFALHSLHLQIMEQELIYAKREILRLECELQQHRMGNIDINNEVEMPNYESEYRYHLLAFNLAKSNANEKITSASVEAYDSNREVCFLEAEYVKLGSRLENARKRNERNQKLLRAAHCKYEWVNTHGNKEVNKALYKKNSYGL